MTFEKAAVLADIPDGAAIGVELSDGTEVALARSGDEVFALRDECTHASVPLSEGDVDGAGIECWLHGSRFDLRTGHPDSLPATEPVPTYATRIDGDDVLVDPTLPNTSGAI